MKKIYETESLLKSIKADELENIYNHITHKAAEWAVGGQLLYANRLLEDVWAFYNADYGNVRRELEGLQIMWELSGNFPSGIPFPFRKIEEIEEENWTDMSILRRYKGRGEDVYALLNPGLSKDCLLVSGVGEEEQILLFPTKEGGWECWYWVIPGGCRETWYPGFRYCLEDWLFFLERII